MIESVNKINSFKIGKNIKKFRQTKNISQDELAEKVYSTKSTISKWENGSIIPSIDMLKIVASALNLSVYDLLGENQPISSKIVTVIAKFFLWILAWVHIDVTFVGVTFALSITMTIVGFTTGIGGSISYIIDSNRGFGFNSARIAIIIGMIFAAPIILVIFGSIGLMLYIIAKEVHMFSRKYFWNSQHVNFNLNELSIFSKINKKIWMIFLVMCILGTLMIIGICIYEGISERHWVDFKMNHL